VIVPSLMKEATAVYDFDGSIAITASGKGGGGAYGLRLLAEAEGQGSPLLDELAAALNSSDTTRWIQLVGDMKRDGYRGVDAFLLGSMPIAKARRSGDYAASSKER
jgi:hypothetical protein